MARVYDYYKKLMEKGVKPTTPLRTQPSKMREFSVTDPDGFTLISGDYTGS